MQQEAHLLYDLCKIPAISKVWCRGAGTLQLTVSFLGKCCVELVDLLPALLTAFSWADLPPCLSSGPTDSAQSGK